MGVKRRGEGAKAVPLPGHEERGMLRPSRGNPTEAIVAEQRVGEGI